MVRILCGQLANSNSTKIKDFPIHLPAVRIAERPTRMRVLVGVERPVDPDKTFLLLVPNVAKLTLYHSSPKGRMYCAETALKPVKDDNRLEL